MGAEPITPPPTVSKPDAMHKHWLIATQNGLRPWFARSPLAKINTEKQFDLGIG